MKPYTPPTINDITLATFTTWCMFSDGWYHMLGGWIHHQTRRSVADGEAIDHFIDALEKAKAGKVVALNVPPF